MTATAPAPGPQEFPVTEITEEPMDRVELSDDDDFEELDNLLLSEADREAKSKLWHEVEKREERKIGEVWKK